MAGVLLIGAGDLPDGDLSVIDFPRLRTWQFLRGMLQSGHDVALVSAHRGGAGEWREARFEGHPLRVLHVSPEALDRADLPERWLRECKAQAVVSAGPFGPARAAARMPSGVPVFIDLPGDLMAEAQLRVARTGDASHLAHAHQVLSMALARGDAFSAISERQRYATLGQLALTGRFSGDAVGWDPVRVIPVGIEPSWQRWADAARSGDRHPARIVWPGAVNTWADIDTLVQASHLAMDRRSDLEVVVTGGPIAGHEERAWAELERAVSSSPHRARWRFTGWVDPVSAARELCEARIAISLDLPCLEAVLGSRTRLVYGLSLGLDWITTSGSELADRLIAMGLAKGVPFKDPVAVCDAILERLETPVESHRSMDGFPSGPGVLAAVRSRVQAGVRDRLLADLEGMTTVRPLLRWLEAPVSAPTGHDLNGHLLQRVQTLEREIDRIHHSPTWQVLSRLHRLVKRRVKADVRNPDTPVSENRTRVRNPDTPS